MTLLLALLSLSYAQTTGTTGAVSGGNVPDINAQYFRPSLDSSRTFWVDESRVPSQLFTPKLLLHYTNKPLIYTFENGDEVPLVAGVAQADVMLSASYDRFRLGVDVPIYLVADGANASGETGLGDLALDGKVMILPEEDGPLGLAVNARVAFPTATVDNALGSPNTGWEISAIADKRFLDDKALLAANVGVRGGPQAELENITVDDYLTWRAGGAYDVKEWVAFSAELVGGYNFRGGQDAAELPLEAMLGAHLLSDDVNIRLGGGAGLTPGIGAPDYRIILGVDFPMENPDPDTDGDGLADSIDECPTEPEDIDTVLDDDGCPDPPTPIVVKVVDPTGKAIDGATIDLAEGPLEPGSYTAKATADGFRPGETTFEVAPAEDEKTVTVTLDPIGGTVVVKVVDTAGEPVPARIVMAGDDVATDAAEFSGERTVGEVFVVAEASGYKIAKTKVMVVADETVEVVLTMLPSKADLVGDRIDIKDSVYFDTAKATIQERSFDLLDEVASIMDNHPELLKLRIEGHTDSRGGADYNKKLSQQRADSVLAYLVEKGVAAERLSAVGYGEEKPIDPAKNAAAYEKNRRVDFFVEARDD